MSARYDEPRLSVAGKLETSHGALASLLAQVRRECPLAASGSPEDSESTQLSNEVIGAMVLTGGRPDLQAIRAFVRSVNGLRRGSRALTRTLQAYARELRAPSRRLARRPCVRMSVRGQPRASERCRRARSSLKRCSWRTGSRPGTSLRSSSAYEDSECEASRGTPNYWKLASRNSKRGKSRRGTAS